MYILFRDTCKADARHFFLFGALREILQTSGLWMIAPNKTLLLLYIETSTFIASKELTKKAVPIKQSALERIIIQ